MSHNEITNACLNSEGVAFQQTIEEFFKTFDDSSFDWHLNSLLQNWLCPDHKSHKSRIEIADSVFFVTTLTTFTRAMNQCQAESKFLRYFYDIYDQSVVEDYLNNMISMWICPAIKGDELPNLIHQEAANFVDFTYNIIKLLLELSLDLKGGSLW